MADKAARRARFEGVYAKVADELAGELRKANIPEEAIDWYRRVSLVFEKKRRALVEIDGITEHRLQRSRRETQSWHVRGRYR